MSDDGLQISDELIGNLVNLIVQHDERANEDMMLGLQYLAAVSGYIAASYPGLIVIGRSYYSIWQHLQVM